MEILMLVGRVLFGGFFLYNGLNHLMKKDELAGYAQYRGVPSPKAAVIASGVLLVLSGIGIIMGMYLHLALWGVIVFLVPTSIMMHKFWVEADQGARQIEKIQFLKNMALIGAALMLL